ncbi:aminotransferase class V-fold PLP-dependent enzyme [Nocardia sp. NPDC051832]|uniref:aminotransferase class V-fold PLP-dependent enzyme n=1 Tax=Nocardia sp. NPDC051832 TaxID=3155673 RepID=UPI00343A0A5A
MKTIAQNEFSLSPDLIQLNHASYGLTSRQVMSAGERVRRHIESDPTVHLGSGLTDQLTEQTTLMAAAFGLNAAQTTLCTNATSGAAAIITSLPLTSGDVVVVLDAEYSSIQRAWEIACTRTGASLVRVPLDLPFTGPDQLLAALDAHVPGTVTYLQVSLISSSAAIWFPVAEASAWVRRRGGRLVVDAAHGPAQVALTPDEWGAAAMFGTLHKWLPTLRPVGFLWLATEFIDSIRPVEVSLTWDSPDLIERFSWPGTFDPVPRLTLHTAIEQWRNWQQDGLLAECEKLADTATEILAELGAKPTAVDGFAPPRMRAFVLDRVDVPEVKTALQHAGVRAWVGPGPRNECLLRAATHIYNDVGDIDILAARVKEVLAR